MINRKKLLKIISFILLAFIVFSFTYETCAITHAVSPWSSVNQFDGKTAKASIRKVFQVPLGVVLSVIRLVAVIVAICMILWAGIRYMAPNFTLFGKVLDQAEVKRDIPRFVIGSLLLFGTSGLLTLIQYAI